jgi:transposase-like protein
MKLIDVHKQFTTEDKCLDYLEQMRWPKGLCCLKCGVEGRISKFRTNETTRKRFSKKFGKVVEVKVPSRRLYECLDCGYQFSATTGTIFNNTHLPLRDWLIAIALFMEAKKSLSANQLKRHLGINYRSAWYLAHRIREAMQDGPFQLTGEVEADETYVGPKVPRKGRPYSKRQEKDVVLGMVERGGRLRLLPVADAKRRILQPALEMHISPDVSMIYTDEHPIYEWGLMKNFYGRHQTINHTRTYAIGKVHTNTIENCFSLFKRSLIGSFHHVSIKHLGRYCNEFSYRFNRRDEQEQMFHETVRNLLRGKSLPYKQLTASSKSDF